MLQDRKSVRKLRAALDEHASPAPRASKMRTFPKLSPHDDERRFERFIRAIRQCTNLSDARRFRSEVASQLKRESMLEGQDHVYLRRLETGKRVLDQRVAKLSAVGSSSRNQSGQNEFGNGQISNRTAKASIRDVLYDASGLSYFMEYMDRHCLMTLVQFWIVVDGFRNPLEDDFFEDSIEIPTHWTESDRQDIAQITEAYFTKSELKVPSSSQEVVRQFLKAGRDATPTQYARARSAVLQAQSSALEEMQEKHFPGFQTSDLYYKYLTSDDGSSKLIGRTAPKALKSPSVPPIAESPTKGGISSRPISRVNSGHPDLRRNATSSGDLRSSIRPPEDYVPHHPRRSFEASRSIPLFDDDIDSEPLARSTQSLDTDSANGDQIGNNQALMVEAMEAALNTIVTAGPQDADAKDPLFESSDMESSMFESETTSPNGFLEVRKPGSVIAGKARDRPNLASLGLVNTSSRIGVFTDDDLFGDEEKFIEDEHTDPEEFLDEKLPEDEIHEAAPGDLGLAEAITALTIDIERLVAQESVVDTLTRKAELTNNIAELRILGKSKSSLQREIRRKELQRQQYIVQESDNSLYGRASIEIKSIMVGKEDDGQEFALYIIEVRRKAGTHDQASSASWAVARRYSEFHDLHQRLRSIYPAVRHLDFPRRRLIMKLQREFLHQRRIALERYLRALLHLPAVCQSRDLRAFLSQQAIISTTALGRDGERRDIVSRIYNSVTDGMDEFLGNIPMLDQLSIAGQNLISAATSQYNANPSISSPTSSSATPTSSTFADPSDTAAQEANAELLASDSPTPVPFITPLSALFLELFNLQRTSNWLRGRAVIVVLHQLLGGTVERKVRETFRSLFADASLLRYLSLAKDTLWADGVLVRERRVRRPEERRKTREEARVVLETLVVDLVGAVVGRGNAGEAGRRVWAGANNGRVLGSLVWRVLDEAVGVVFPEVKA